MATVKIPPVLRPSVGGEKEVQAAGEDVGSVLQSLAEQHPDTQSQLFSGEGQLNRYVNVYLNDEDVRVLDGLETTVSETDTLVILPAMAGGCPGSAPSRHRVALLPGRPEVRSLRWGHGSHRPLPRRSSSARS